MPFDESKWKKEALNKQGDFIVEVIKGMNLSKYLRADLDTLDRTLVKLGHDFTRQQIRAGAQNALERNLLDKEGYDRYFIPIENQPRKYKPKQKRVSS